MQIGLVVVVVAVTAALFRVAMRLTTRDVSKNAKRLREIEREVNKRSGDALLQWAGEVTGHIWAKAEPKPRPEEMRKFEK